MHKIKRYGMAIDLGTANTVVHVRGRGIVINEPTMVAVETVNGVRRLMAVGSGAKHMAGKTTGAIEVIQPLRDGVIADIEIAEEMIKHFVRKAHGGKMRPWHSPEIVICVPSGSSASERRAIRDAVLSTGVKTVHLLDEPMAAAIGAELPVTKPMASMIVDIGGGTSEIAVLSLRGLIYKASLRVGGNKMNESIVSHVRRNHKLLISEMMAERLKVELGVTIRKTNGSASRKVIGRDLVSGLPKSMAVTRKEVTEALTDTISAIIGAVRTGLETIDAELLADLCDWGIVLTGGGAMMHGLEEAMGAATGLPIVVAENPITCVARGSGMVLENESLRSLLT